MTRPGGIATKFISAIILFSLLLAVIGTCLQLYVDYRKDLDTISRQLSYVETSHQKSLVNDIWLFNDRGMEEQLKGILGLPMIEAVRVERPNSPAIEVGKVTARRPIVHRVHLSHQYRGKEMALGTLQITASADYAFERMKERALLILLTQFVEISIVAAFIFFLFYLMIGRHLQVMARHAREVTVSTLDQPLQLHRTGKTDRRQDELDLLAAAFNQMQQQLGSYIRERLEIEGQLREEIEERKRMEGILHEQATQLEDEIAQRQRTQEELNLLNTTLEERIAATISELRQKDDLLIQQNRMAAMGELLNNIAHQWRQPLNNIAVHLQTMQYLKRAGELTDEEMDSDIKAVMDILQYMSHTIDDFRGFFVRDRSTAHEFPLVPTITKALTLVTPALTASNIRVELLKDDREDLRINGYPNEFAQVLVNILYNARDILVEREVKYPRIEIMVSREQEKTVITVRDNGGGISADALPHIFDPYFTTKGPAKGTGIGLYMSKTIVEKNMGGTLTARNTKEGAEFRIEL